ncbi:MAG: hypothetical protein HKO71_05055 [Pseudomonadales bacterium]|nr:hypothetical protein [Pseudomonadales bacterium]
MVSIYEPGAATGDPEPEPQPEPEPEPEPEPINTPPSVSFATPQANAQLQAGVDLSVALQASDSDSGVAHCDLSINGSFVGRDSSAPYLYTGAALVNLAAGSYTLAATCVDNGGLASNAVRSITVLPAPEPEPEPEPVNTAPVVNITSPAHGSSLQAGSAVSVSVAASDSDGSIAYCDLSVNNSFIGRDSSAPYLFSGASLNNLSAGNYALQATCSDNQGLGSSAQSSITVTAPPEPPNVAPSASFVSPANNQVFTQGDAIYVNIDAQDSDGTVQNCSLTLNGNTVRTESAAPYEWGITPTWTDAQFVDLAPGSYTLVGRCTDDDNEATSIQRNFLVEAAPEIPPLVSFSAPAAGGTFQAGDSIEVALAASDSDGNVAYCDLFFNGDLVGRDSTAPYQYSGATLAGLVEGSHTLHASCVDNAGLTASAQLALVVEAATTPTLANVLLDWIVPTTREDGTALPASDIESYEIYYYEGSNSAAGNNINVPATDAGGNLVTSYQVSGLASGNYFFSIATIDTDGNVSEFVEPVPLLIQ